MKLNELRVQAPVTKTYLGSPSILRLPNGDLLATHGYYGPGCPLNHEGEEHLTSVYRSQDNGQTWRNVTHIANAFWSSLFAVEGIVYVIGTTQQHGSIAIRRSEDGSYTWTRPADGHSGLLFAGGPGRSAPNYHCAPVTVLVRHERIYRAFEANAPLGWPSGFQACVISAEADAELLDASSWRMSNKLAFRVDWLPEEYGARLSLDPTQGFVELPGGHSKFTIRYDSQSERYLTLSNGVHDPNEPSLRSVLSMYASVDLRSGSHCLTLLTDDSRLLPELSAQRTGFQYVDWQFDGEDIIYLVRTANAGAHSYHDANRITFHRLRGFRRWIAR